MCFVSPTSSESVARHRFSQFLHNQPNRAYRVSVKYQYRTVKKKLKLRIEIRIFSLHGISLHNFIVRLESRQVAKKKNSNSNRSVLQIHSICVCTSRRRRLNIRTTFAIQTIKFMSVSETSNSHHRVAFMLSSLSKRRAHIKCNHHDRDEAILAASW